MYDFSDVETFNIMSIKLKNSFNLKINTSNYKTN